MPEVREDVHHPGVVNCASYAGGQRVADLAICDIHEVLKQKDRFVWIGLYEPREEILREVQTEFGLHDLAIEDAIAFHNTLGTRRKEARLRYLQNYWTGKVRELPNVVMNTPSDPKRSCAIANVGIKGVKPPDLAKTLLDKYRIWTNAIDSEPAGVHGVRVTPHVFILPKELDTLVKAIAEIARST